MRILMVNKFLYPNGGSETYIIKTGEALRKMGCEVEYFGMADGRNTLGNSLGVYSKNKEFKSGASLSKLTYPFEIIYSADAAKKIGRLLDEFKPDVVHLNNINFQITPSIIPVIKKHNIPIVWTLHDYQLICPNHMMYIPDKGSICEKCTEGGFMNCFKNKCIHGSSAQSILGAVEAAFYKKSGIYSKVDKFICPSDFLMKKLGKRAEFNNKCIMLHNFIEKPEDIKTEVGGYVLYFGRYDREKGIETLLRVCRALPEVRFVFAGSGELEGEINAVSNIENVGFKRGEELDLLIRRAKMTVYPSEWYENCPFSIMESLSRSTPVIGAKIGGIPELIRDGETGILYESKNAEELKRAILRLWNNPDELGNMRKNCEKLEFDTTETYCDKLLKIYRELAQ